MATLSLVFRVVKTDQSARNYVGGADLLVLFKLFGITYDKAVLTLANLASAFGFLLAVLKLAKD